MLILIVPLLIVAAGVAVFSFRAAHPKTYQHTDVIPPSPELVAAREAYKADKVAYVTRAENERLLHLEEKRMRKANKVKVLR